MILAIASTAQGHTNPIPKLLIWGIAALLYGLIGLLIGGLVTAAIATALPVLWFLVFRRGKQAQVELRKMDTENYPDTTYLDVLAAHYFTGWLTCLGLYLFNYSTEWGQKLGWEKQAADTGKWHGKPVRVDVDGRVHPDDFPIWDCRRPTECLTGLNGDIMVTVALIILAGGS